MKPVVEMGQLMAQTARDLGLNEHTPPPWIGTYHRAERRKPQLRDAQVYIDFEQPRG